METATHIHTKVKLISETTAKTWEDNIKTDLKETMCENVDSG
jgi:hypothetical protein